MENVTTQERLELMESKFNEMSAECRAVREELKETEDKLLEMQESAFAQKTNLVEEIAKTKLDVEKVCGVVVVGENINKVYHIGVCHTSLIIIV
jgi:hypothetical protein